MEEEGVEDTVMVGEEDETTGGTCEFCELEIRRDEL